MSSLHRTARLALLLSFAFFGPNAPIAWAEIHVPAATCYAVPSERGVRISDAGVTQWRDPQIKLRWFGKFPNAGVLDAVVSIRPTADRAIQLRLSVGKQHSDITSQGKRGESIELDFGSFELKETGYHSITLSSLDETPGCDVDALVLGGEAANEAHFNLNSRRNAASVHLFYPLPDKNLEVNAFYCEMTGVEDPIWTYYMACGWHRGYFGMQVNSPTERRIIFSVWDSGGEPIDRQKVAEQDRVTLVDKGEAVYSGDFGNEGTGGHSHLKFLWKTGQTQRFLVTAEPVDETHTVFSGYYFRPDQKKWMLISSWKAPKEGKYLRGLYSFSENFVGRGGHHVRKAFYGNQWIRTAEGEWIELTEATFSHDPTGKADRLDRFGGADGDRFFLSHGGFINGYTEYGHRFQRAPSKRSPAQMKLPIDP